MPNINAIVSSELKDRADAIDELVDRADDFAPGDASTPVVDDLNAAAVALNQDIVTQGEKANQSCGFFAFSCKSEKKAAPELKAASEVLASTVRSLVERYGNQPGRTLGLQPRVWQQRLDAINQRAEASLAALRGGDVESANALRAEVGELVEAIHSLEAESGRDRAALQTMQKPITSYQAIADDEGLFNGRRQEKRLLSSAKSAHTELGREIPEQQTVSQSGRDMLRPLVIGQLVHDPAFADRGYVDLGKKAAAYGPVIDTTRGAGDAAEVLHRSASDLHRANVTIANGPERIAQLQSALDTAVTQHQVATAELSQQTGIFVREDAQLAQRQAFAHQEAADAAHYLDDMRFAFGETQAIVGEWQREVYALEEEVAEIEEQIRYYDDGSSGDIGQQDGTTEDPFADSPTYGQQDGTTQDPFADGNGVSLDELYAQLEAAEYNLDDARRALEDAAIHLQQAEEELYYAQDLYDGAMARFDSIVYEREQIAATLQSYQTAYDRAEAAKGRAESALAQGQADVVAAHETVSQTLAALEAQVAGVNLAIEASRAALAAAELDPEGAAALEQAFARVPEAVTRDAVVQSAEVGGQVELTADIVASTTGVASVARAGRDTLQNRIEAIVTNEVKSTLAQ